MALKLLGFFMVISLAFLTVLQSSSFDVDLLQQSFNTKQEEINYFSAIEEAFPYFSEDILYGESIQIGEDVGGPLQQNVFIVRQEEENVVWKSFDQETEDYDVTEDRYTRTFSFNTGEEVGDSVYFKAEGLTSNQRVTFVIETPFERIEDQFIGGYQEMIKVDQIPQPLTSIKLISEPGQYLGSAKVIILKQRSLWLVAYKPENLNRPLASRKITITSENRTNNITF